MWTFHLLTKPRRIDRYDAFIVGSPIQAREWSDDAIAFLKEHRRKLVTPPVWLFHTQPGTSEKARLPADVLLLAGRIGARGVQTFTADSPADPGSEDATLSGDAANAEAIEQLATLVVNKLHRRSAV